MGLSTLLGLFGGVSAQLHSCSGAHRDDLFTSTTLGTWTNSSVPPSFTLLRGNIFSGQRCRGIRPSIRSFNRSPGQYPGVRLANRSPAFLPAARCGLFARGGGGFNHRALGDSLSLCRQRPGRRAPSGWFHRTARVGQVQLAGFALACGGWRGLVTDSSLFLETAKSAPTGMASGSFALPFGLGSSSTCLLLCQ
jgi:hypothetical protein